MSEQPPSRDLNFKFEIVLDKEKETDIQRIKRWIARQTPPWNTILEYLFSFFEKWYWDTKVQLTMDDVDRQAKEIVEQWNEEEKELEEVKAKVLEKNEETRFLNANFVEEKKKVKDANFQLKQANNTIVELNEAAEEKD